MRNTIAVVINMQISSRVYSSLVAEAISNIVRTLLHDCKYSIIELHTKDYFYNSDFPSNVIGSIVGGKHTSGPNISLNRFTKYEDLDHLGKKYDRVIYIGPEPTYYVTSLEIKTRLVESIFIDGYCNFMYFKTKSDNLIDVKETILKDYKEFRKTCRNVEFKLNRMKLLLNFQVDYFKLVYPSYTKRRNLKEDIYKYHIMEMSKVLNTTSLNSMLTSLRDSKHFGIMSFINWKDYSLHIRTNILTIGSLNIVKVKDGYIAMCKPMPLIYGNITPLPFTDYELKMFYTMRAMRPVTTYGSIVDFTAEEKSCHYTNRI